MRSLVIHPRDKSTDFLKPIYANLHNKTVINTMQDYDGLKDITESATIVQELDEPDEDPILPWPDLEGLTPDELDRLAAEQGAGADPNDEDLYDVNKDPYFDDSPDKQWKGDWYSTSDDGWITKHGYESDKRDSPYLDGGVSQRVNAEYDRWQEYWKDRFHKAQEKGKKWGWSGGSYGKSYTPPKPRDISILIPKKNPFDRFLMMGHGSPSGLFSTIHAGGMLINDNTTRLLKPCSQNVYIWCNADKFVREQKLRGFFTGMFISEVGEAKMCNIKNPTQKMVDESNNAFAEIVGKYINDPVQQLHTKVRAEYGDLTETNPVADYNWNRLYLL